MSVASDRDAPLSSHVGELDRDRSSMARRRRRGQGSR